jgi:hypothetical protein
MPRPANRLEPPPPPSLVASPMCLACGSLMRLERIAPHDKKAHTENRTYACACGYEIIQTIEI